jgi:hypothetical protein
VVLGNKGWDAALLHFLFLILQMLVHLFQGALHLGQPIPTLLHGFLMFHLFLQVACDSVLCFLCLVLQTPNQGFQLAALKCI